MPRTRIEIGGEMDAAAVRALAEAALRDACGPAEGAGAPTGRPFESAGAIEAYVAACADAGIAVEFETPTGSVGFSSVEEACRERGLPYRQERDPDGPDEPEPLYGFVEAFDGSRVGYYQVDTAGRPTMGEHMAGLARDFGGFEGLVAWVDAAVVPGATPAVRSPRAR